MRIATTYNPAGFKRIIEHRLSLKCCNVFRDHFDLQE
jgi:hypothetical protein